MSSPRVIIIEDSATLAALASRGLRLAGIHNVDFATNGHDALALINATKPDLILLDLRLPDMEGWEVLDYARQRHGEFAFHVIVMTTYDNAGTRSLATQYHVDRYVIKPVMPNELVTIISEVMAQKV